MRSSRISQGCLRRLLALLTVVAAFAFQARVGGMVSLPAVSGPAMALPAGPAHAGSAAHHPAPAAAPPHRPDHRTGHTGEPAAHNHGAHCLFCVTGAFALEVGAAGLPNAPPSHAAPLLHHNTADLPAAPRHADARAPPPLL